MPAQEIRTSSQRSRSPANRYHHVRSRSPQSRHHHPVSHKHKRLKPSASMHLPFQALKLHKHDFEALKPMFELYLDIQKQKVLEELPNDEVHGRWKSFIGKWNRGELAEGWYDPATLQKAQASVAMNAVDAVRQSRLQDSPSYGSPRRAEESSDEDIVGPAMPGNETQVYKNENRRGPTIPNLQDLELRRELEQEDVLAQRRNLRELQHVDHKQQKERLDELVPRAEAGSKDRMLEKKREKADSNRAFASSKTEAGGVEEVPESDLLGADDWGPDEVKKQQREMDRKKNEREVRREEALRARREELEQRRRDYRAKEEKTMKGLVALAKAKFG
ncbi:hypothetical protein BDR22DRAFT_894252 [Usnea florida]